MARRDAVEAASRGSSGPVIPRREEPARLLFDPWPEARLGAVPAASFDGGAGRPHRPSGPDGGAGGAARP